MSVILQDANGGLWQLTVDDNGVLATSSVGSGTPSNIILNNVGQTTSWKLGVTTFGQPDTIPAAFNPSNPTFITLLSVTSLSEWDLGVDNNGVLLDLTVPLAVLGSGKVTLIVAGIGRIN
jgi:hypothetical protein